MNVIVDYIIAIISVLLYSSNLLAASQQIRQVVSLEYITDTLSIYSDAACVEKIKYENELLRYENYRKSFLPAMALTLSPINFNRSLRLLQQAADGNYSYVEDYANNSRFAFHVNQKISVTGGELQIGSDLNCLHEYSRHRKSFSTSPYYISYSQQLWGGRKLYQLEKRIEESKLQNALRQYCTNITHIQQKVLDLSMAVLAYKMKCRLSYQTKLNNDTLLHIGKVKLNNGHITEYQYRQIELQF